MTLGLHRRSPECRRLASGAGRTSEQPRELAARLSVCRVVSVSRVVVPLSAHIFLSLKGIMVKFPSTWLPVAWLLRGLSSASDRGGTGGGAVDRSTCRGPGVLVPSQQ